MSLVVETGQIAEGASSYVTIAEANAYHTDRLNSAWTGSDAAKTAAILKATAFIENKFNHRWKGYRTKPSVQVLAWPRSLVNQFDDPLAKYIDHFTIPQCLKDAVCEAALRALTGDLIPDLKRGGQVKRKKVGPIETEYFASASATTTFPIIENLLSTLLKPKSSDAVRG